MDEYMIELWYFLEDFREPLLSLQYIYCKNSFSYKTETNLSFVSFENAQISKILNFLFIFKLPLSKPFWNNLNYASTSNIQELIKFQNPGDQSFETDFSLKPKFWSACSIRLLW